MSTAAPETTSLPMRSETGTEPDRFFWLRLTATTFLGAFLLFQVQPLIGKVLLPWYGGTPAVWTTTLLFFQLMLVAGYALAHFSVRYLSPTIRSYVFMAIAICALVLLPILPGESWKPSATDDPLRHLPVLLLICVGGPYFVLASTAPTTQEWFARSGSKRSPYRLYALSNLGSLLGLLTYPFLVERFFDLKTQSYLWSGTFVVYALLAASCAWTVRKQAGEPQRKPDADTTSAAAEARISVRQWSTWIGLSAASSVLLMSSTQLLCQDIASVPFLWVAPLVVYLLTFIICFDHARWYCRTWYCAASAILIPWACLQGVTFAALERSKVWTAPMVLHLRDLTFVGQAIVVLAMLFSVCMLCHGELAARKPSPSRLTLYFLLISIGGALGGILTAVVAPLVFDRNWEWILITFGAFCFALAGLAATPRIAALLKNRTYRLGTATIGLAGAALLIWLDVLLFNENEIVSARNFYGIVSVDVGNTGRQRELPYISMRSGTTFHGLQLVGESRRRIPTAYYASESGVGMTLLEARRSDRPLRVAVIGLGAGTLATYGQADDVYDFYEISPVVIRFAHDYFSFLSDSEARCNVTAGDARLSLENSVRARGNQSVDQAGDQTVDDARYDVVVLDAFSGDAIPTHLLTVEAFDLYLKNLRDDGILAVHVSNRHLDLIPVVAAAAKQLGLAGMWGVNRPDAEMYVQPARWALLTRSPDTERWQRLQKAGFTDLDRSPAVRVWTDAYSNLFEILK